MGMKMIEQIYDTLTGNLVEEHQFPGIENAFSAGKPCDVLYSQVYSFYQQICEQENTKEQEAADGIINNMLEICRIIGFRMFEYGMQYANNEINPAD